MEGNKTYCQDIITQLDNCLLKRNISIWEVTCSLKNGLLSEFIIVFVIAFTYYQEKYELLSYETIFSSSYASTFVNIYLVYAIFRRVYKMKTFLSNGISELDNEIAKLKTELESFANYSDVKNYIIHYDQEIENANKFKRKFRILHNTTRVVFYAAAIYLGSIAPLATNFTAKNDVVYQLKELLGYSSTEPQVSDNTPYISLIPYRQTIDDNCTMKNTKVELFLHKKEEVLRSSYKTSVNKHFYFTTTAPEIECTDSCCNTFRMLITDTLGTPVSYYLKFSFKIGDNDTIQSDRIELDNYDMAVQALHYLRQNESALRFKIERMY